MFGSLMNSNPRSNAKGLRASYASSGSIVLHAAILFAFLAASYLHVEPLAQPSLRTIQIVIPPPNPPPAAPPPPAPPPGPTESRAQSSKEAVTIPEETIDVAQPRDLPTEIPVLEERTGESGVEGGIEGGVPGGIPGGVPGGIPGGIRGGVPGGVRGGLPDVVLGGDQPVYLTGNVRPPERTTFVKPDYPELARKVRREGKVILEIVVGKSGNVERVKILKSDPLFDQSAIEAVEKWKYQPALQNGFPVKVYLTVIVQFELR